MQYVHAQGEHSRRAGAELRVVLGDLRQVSEFSGSSTLPQLKTGLRDRILGGLSALDLLFRLADQEAGRSPENYSELIKTAFTHADAERWKQILILLSPLKNQFMLEQAAYPDSTALRSSSIELHQRLCAGCHDSPLLTVERPAYNLFEQSASMSDTEFYARMLIGVRGDRVTGIDNPFSDAELAGLIFFYQSKTKNN